MRVSLTVLIIGLAAGSNVSFTEAREEVGFSAGLKIQSVADFDTPLSGYGTWVRAAPYGHCWRPSSVPPGWRPYVNGSWEWTDAGWYWVSDERWAWACYHYGYWVLDANYGWVWIPGTDWAPAWVAWRESPDYIGWAPCPMGNFEVAPSAFVFVDIHQFHQRIRPDLLVISNPTIIEHTRLTRNFRRERHEFNGVARNIVADPGPSLDPIQRATGTTFRGRPVGELVAQTPVPSNFRRGRAGQGSERPEAPTGREQPRVFPNTPTPAPPARPNSPPLPGTRSLPTARSRPEMPTPPNMVPQPEAPPRRSVPQPAPVLVPRRDTPLPPTGREPGEVRDNRMQRQQMVPPAEQRPPAREPQDTKASPEPDKKRDHE